MDLYDVFAQHGVEEEPVDPMQWDTFLEELHATPVGNRIPKLFLQFVKELWAIPEMPETMWPVATKFAAMLQDGLDDTVEAERKKSTTKLCKKAANARHQPLREFKDKAAIVIRREIENGTTLFHHKIAEYLEVDYQEGGDHPFMFLPDECGCRDRSPRKILTGVAKKVAEEMNRHDLIFGGCRKK